MFKFIIHLAFWIISLLGIYKAEATNTEYNGTSDLFATFKSDKIIAQMEKEPKIHLNSVNTITYCKEND